jgi:predicted amidohydrolase YtcJ
MVRHPLAALALTLLAGCQAAPRIAADLVILDGDVRTMNAATPRATAIVAHAGRIAYVGDERGARQWIGSKTRVVDARGHTVLPGLIDSHIHVMEGALARGACSLHDEPLTLGAAAAAIRECAARPPGTGWVIVHDVNGVGFDASARSIDAIVRDRPVLLWGADGHTAWVNSAALRAARITAATRDPRAGRFERDTSGAPTGFLVDEAVTRVTDIAIQPTPAQRIDALRVTLPELHAAGITSFMEANTDAATLLAYVELARDKQLHAHVSIALQSDGEDDEEEFARLRHLREQVAHEPLLRADVIKLFADGIMEYPTQTAALVAPYLNADGTPTCKRGRLYLDPVAMAEFVRQAADAGFGIHIHAIGDGAVRAGLDAFAAARSAGSKQRYSIAHLELVDPADLPRFGALDVFASLQLFWAQPDNYSVDAVKPYLGAERHARLYPARALLAAGATVAGGSDWNVSSYNPFEAMATGMSRMNPQQPGRGTLNAAEALTLEEMLAAYTVNAARMLGREDEIGSLGAGMAADIIVLDRRLVVATSANELRQTRVTHTFIAGRPAPPAH